MRYFKLMMVVIVVFMTERGMSQIGATIARQMILNERNQVDDDEAIPFMGAWGMSYDSNLGNFLYFEGIFSEDIEDVDVYCYNPKTGERYEIADDKYVSEGMTIHINPNTGWLWNYGEYLIIRAPGYERMKFKVPNAGTYSYSRFATQAQKYHQQKMNQYGGYDWSSVERSDATQRFLMEDSRIFMENLDSWQRMNEQKAKRSAPKYY